MHGIKENDNMMYNSQNGKPWHGIGTAVDGLATSAQAIQKAGLDWTAQVKELTTADGIPVEQSKAIVRSDTNEVLGVVGNRYQPLQNVEAFEFFDDIVGAEQAIYETAGSLGNGQRVWLLAKMPDFIQVGNSDDVIEKYVLLSNSHDGSSPVNVLVSPIRVVCANTLTLALKTADKRRLTVRHTASMKDRMKEAEKVLDITNKIYQEVGDIFNAMSNVKMGVKQTEEFFADVLGRDEDGELSTAKKNLIWHNPQFENSGILTQLVEEGAGSDINGVRGTLWGAYNALTEFVDHHKTFSKNTDHLDAIWFSGGAKLKENAMSVAKNML